MVSAPMIHHIFYDINCLLQYDMMQMLYTNDEEKKYKKKRNINIAVKMIFQQQYITVY